MTPIQSKADIAERFKAADNALSRAMRFYARGQYADALAYAIIARDCIEQIIASIGRPKK